MSVIIAIGAIGMISFIVAVIGAIMGHLLLMQMIRDINRKRHGEDRIPYLGFTAGKLSRILEAYRREYPAGRAERQFKLTLLVSAIGMLGAVASLAIAGQVIEGPIGRDAAAHAAQQSRR